MPEHRFYDGYTVVTPAQLAEQTRAALAEAEGQIHGHDLTILVNLHLAATKQGAEFKEVMGAVDKARRERQTQIRIVPVLRARYELELAAIPKEEEEPQDDGEDVERGA